MANTHPRDRVLAQVTGIKNHRELLEAILDMNRDRITDNDHVLKLDRDTEHHRDVDLDSANDADRDRDIDHSRGPEHDRVGRSNGVKIMNTSNSLKQS